MAIVQNLNLDVLGGTVHVVSGKTVVDKLWDEIQGIIQMAHTVMFRFLHIIGVE